MPSSCSTAWTWRKPAQTNHHIYVPQRDNTRETRQNSSTISAKALGQLAIPWLCLRCRFGRLDLVARPHATSNCHVVSVANTVPVRLQSFCRFCHSNARLFDSQVCSSWSKVQWHLGISQHGEPPAVTSMTSMLFAHYVVTDIVPTMDCAVLFCNDVFSFMIVNKNSLFGSEAEFVECLTQQASVKWVTSNYLRCREAPDFACPVEDHGVRDHTHHSDLHPGLCVQSGVVHIFWYTWCLACQHSCMEMIFCKKTCAWIQDKTKFWHSLHWISAGFVFKGHATWLQIFANVWWIRWPNYK